MKLSRVERWILSNQYRILEALHPDDADYYANAREAIENGYELHYRSISQYIYDDVMTDEECEEVIDILSMFRALRRTYEALPDKSGIAEQRVTFVGFDGNDKVEGRYLSYARYFCNQEGGRFTEIGRGDDFNSHWPALETYRRMLQAWNVSPDKYNLSQEDIIRITSAWG